MIPVFSGYGLYYVIPLFLKLKQPLKLAQPSMAKKLRMGAAPKDSGEWLVLLPVVLVLCDCCAGFSDG